MSPKSASKRRRRPVQARSEATVAAILEATAQVLESQGYEGATTGRIAERAGVSVGSLYQYFPTKDAIVVELVERYFAELSERLLATLAQSAEAPIEQAVDAMAETIFDLHRERALRHRAFQQLLMQMDGIDLVDRLLSRVEAVVAETLAGREDTLRIDDPVLAAQVLCRAVAGLVRGTLRREPQKFTDPAFQRELATLVLRYLVP